MNAAVTAPQARPGARRPSEPGARERPDARVIVAATTSAVPVSASPLGRSPSQAMAPSVASSGPPPRASGYTSDRSPTR